MLEKDKGILRIHRLRIIQLFEADYNFLLALVFGHRLTTFSRNHCSINASQYGSTQGKRCQSVVLNKILTYDILRLLRQDGGTTEFDASQCFDNLIPTLVVLACRRLGLGRQPGNMFLDSLEGMQHQVRTADGKSYIYTSTDQTELFGTGQGSGSSPTSWNAIDEVILNTMDSLGKGTVLSNPDSTVVNSRNEDGFVDDAALGVTGNDIDIPEELARKTQQHEQSLYASGGRLALHKCTWTILQWAWTEGVSHLITYAKDDQGRCTSTSPHTLPVTQTTNGEVTMIAQLHPNTSYKTLGIWVAADGNEAKQIEILRGKINHWTKLVDHSHLNAYEKQIAYLQFLKPQIGYPLPCLKIPHKTLKKIFRPVLTNILHSLNLNKNFPLDIVHASNKYFGLEIDDFHFRRGIAQIQYVLGHLNIMDRTGELISIALDNSELIGGMGSMLHDHIPHTWLKALCQFLKDTNSNIETRSERAIPLQRYNDHFLMRIGAQENLDMPLLQQFRLWMQVSTVSDVATAMGTMIEPWARTNQGRTSTLQWPRQGKPSKRAWKEWNRLLQHITITDIHGVRLLK